MLFGIRLGSFVYIPNTKFEFVVIVYISKLADEMVTNALHDPIWINIELMTKIIDLIIYIFIFENWITFASGKCSQVVIQYNSGKRKKTVLKPFIQSIW